MKQLKLFIAESLYEVAVTLLAPFVGFAFLFHPRGKLRLAERFGWRSLPRPFMYWGHGASVGEIRGLIPILLRLGATDSLITATSPTGLTIVPDAFQKGLLPFDSRFFLHRMFRHGGLKGIFLSESDVWPIFIGIASKRKIPLFLVNGRIRDETVRRIKKSTLLTHAIHRIHHFCVEDTRSQENLLALGIQAEKISVTGNAKYSSLLTEQHAMPARSFFLSSPLPSVILTIGSIRPKEEEHLFPIILALLQQYQSLKVIIAPRHAEKFQWFREKLSSLGVPFSNVSDGEASPHSLLLYDQFGGLQEVYRQSHIVIIGGTFTPGIGGHNPLEAAQWSVPVLVGPYHEKIETLITASRGILAVNSVEALMPQIQSLLNNPGLRHDLGEAAFKDWQQFDGAADKTVAIIERYL